MGEEWIVDVNAGIERARQSSKETSVPRSKGSIFRVPKIFKKRKDDPYTPRIASFGPYHHGQKHLMPMEQYKHRVLHCFFYKRSKNRVEEVVEMMRKEVRELMESYDGLEEPWTKDENRFLGLMILDGCFLLEVLLSSVPNQLERLDPILSKEYIRDALWMDIALVENQLPMPVLDILLNGVDYEITRRLYNLIGSSQGNVRECGLHWLDAIRKARFGGCYWYSPSFVIPPATELFEAGVNICKSDSLSYNDISFSDGELKIPVIFVHDLTEVRLLNYIAFERRHCKSYNVSSYVFFMDGLINTTADMALLRKRGIIQGWMGSDDDITNIFNRLPKGLSPSPGNQSSRKNVNKELVEYCHRMWPQWRASFVRSYLGSPWLFISFLGALILLFLSVVQTVYTVFPYYHHP